MIFMQVPVTTTPLPRQWTTYERLAFRWFFLFSLVLLIPADGKYLRQVAALKWSRLTYVDVDLLSNYYPWSIDLNSGNDYRAPLLFLGISLALALLWSALDKRRQEYNTLYYWLKVIIRYKVAGVMFYFAFIKVFPVQMPFPTVSQLNTIVGDYTPGRLFWIATGASPGYEIFGGVMELLATVLLLFRRTTTLGAFLMVIVMVPIVAINVFYDTGVQIKSILILLLSLFLLAENIRRIWRFLVLQLPESVIYFETPALTRAWQRWGRIGLKTAFLLFFFGFRGISVATAYHAGKSFKLPEDRGLPALKGFYTVKTFSVNGRELPYDPLDSVRWQNLAFEEWNTISIKVTRPVRLQVNNNVRKTEIHSNAGRHYFAFRADTVNRVLYLKNRADTSQKLVLHYACADVSRILLQGVDEKKDSIKVVLSKIQRDYPLIEGRHARDYVTW
jgi:hypothetical protein